jgi:hypothetical protein
MIETKLQELTAAVTQLTTVAEALLETLRHQTASTTTSVTSGTAATTTTVEAAPEPAPKPKKAKAPKVEEPAPAPAPEPAPAPAAELPTIEDLRAAAQAALDAGKLTEVVALNKRHGVKRISEVDQSLYAEIIAELKGLVAADGQA